MDDNEIITIINLVPFIIVIIYVIYRNYKEKNSKNELSFDDYTHYYGNSLPTDTEFNNKINRIKELILNDNIYDIKKIAKESNCKIEECVLKIKYLNSKKIIDNFYIDTENYLLVKCSQEDLKLLKKYEPYIYNSRLQINEIANTIPNKKCNDIHEVREEIYNELKYLDQKKLLNGIKFDEIDREIIYDIKENVKEKNDYESIHCQNCGAINDVNSSEKKRCKYCNNIIKGSKYEE